MSETGISHFIDLNGSHPSEEQVAIYAVLIRSLRDIAYEHIVFDFEDPDVPENLRRGLAFFQICVAHGQTMHVEIRIDTINGPTQYSKTCSINESIQLMRETIATREAPALDGWKDITSSVYSKRKPDGI